MFSIQVTHVFSRLLQLVLLSSIPLVAKIIFDLYFKLRKSCDLPVLNLDGWRFEEAKERYISDLFGYLKYGREKVCHHLQEISPHCVKAAVVL